MTQQGHAIGDADKARQVATALAMARPRWVSFVQRRVPADIDPEDVVQRALARAARNADRLRDPARLVPWFYRILRHTVVDALAARAAGPESVADEVLDELAAPPAGEELAGACACLAELLNELRPEYAAVLRRVVLEDESLREAAAGLAISENNAAVRLHRARGALRRRIEACCGVTSLRACLDCTCDIDGRCGGRAPES